MQGRKKSIEITWYLSEINHSSCKNRLENSDAIIFNAIFGKSTGNFKVMFSNKLSAQIRESVISRGNFKQFSLTQPELQYDRKV